MDSSERNDSIENRRGAVHVSRDGMVARNALSVRETVSHRQRRTIVWFKWKTSTEVSETSPHQTPIDRLEKLVQIATNRSEEHLSFTDGGSEGYMTGSLNGSAVYTVGDGCDNIQDCIDAQKAFNPVGKSPFLQRVLHGMAHTLGRERCKHMMLGTSRATDFNATIRQSLHGTWRYELGFWNGANGNGGTDYQPTITSYDYNSPTPRADRTDGIKVSISLRRWLVF